METSSFLREVAITAIIMDGDKYLITRRSPNKKRFPGTWTVPCGKLEAKDYLALPKDTHDYWYNVLERTLAREVKEETDQFAWVTIDEAKNYDLIDGIYQEFVMVERRKKGEQNVVWEK